MFYSTFYWFIDSPPSRNKNKWNPEFTKIVHSMNHSGILGQQIRRGNGIGGGVEGGQAFARHGFCRCRRLTTVGEGCVEAYAAFPRDKPTTV